jgi:hypothetical protein
MLFSFKGDQELCAAPEHARLLGSTVTAAETAPPSEMQFELVGAANNTQIAAGANENNIDVTEGTSGNAATAVSASASRGDDRESLDGHDFLFILREKNDKTPPPPPSHIRLRVSTATAPVTSCTACFGRPA